MQAPDIARPMPAAGRPVQLHDVRFDPAHDALAAQIEALASAADDAIAPALATFERLAAEHFAEEDALMQDVRFASRDCHLDEHAAVLASVRQVRSMLAEGHREVARRLVRELARWLPEHVAALDAQLEQALFRQAHGGGTRLVLHR